MRSTFGKSNQEALQLDTGFHLYVPKLRLITRIVFHMFSVLFHTRLPHRLLSLETSLPDVTLHAKRIDITPTLFPFHQPVAKHTIPG